MLITAAGRAALLMYLQLEEREGLTSAGVNGSALIGFYARKVAPHPRSATAHAHAHAHALAPLRTRGSSGTDALQADSSVKV